jgi:hypothetical protein
MVPKDSNSAFIPLASTLPTDAHFSDSIPEQYQLVRREAVPLATPRSFPRLQWQRRLRRRLQLFSPALCLPKRTYRDKTNICVFHVRGGYSANQVFVSIANLKALDADACAYSYRKRDTRRAPAEALARGWVARVITTNFSFLCHREVAVRSGASRHIPNPKWLKRPYV